MKKNLPPLYFILVFFLFTSCLPSWDNRKVTGKTTIKNFEHLNDPLVILADVTWPKTFLGIPGLGWDSYNRGNVFIVIDWETNTIFDWIYYPSTPGSVLKRAVELGTSQKKYYSSSSEGVIGCISPDSNKVTIYDTSDVDGYLEPCFLKGKTAILWDDSENVPLTTCRFFDSEKGKILEDKFTLYAGPNITHPIENLEGDLWISFTGRKDYLTHVGKIKINNKSYEELVSFKARGSCKILTEEKGFLYMSESTSNEEYNSLYKFDSNTGDLILKKDIYVGDNVNLGAHFTCCFIYKSNMYAVHFGNSIETDNFAVWVYEINLDTLEVERISDRIDIWATENKWLRGSRIYFMYGNDSYTYFDLDTWEKAPYTYVMDYSTMTINCK
ncbi:MAG: hypothetical protein K6D95_00780 [Treponema sp.]|nr:hypothetical protein [Treponema sp.]